MKKLIIAVFTAAILMISCTETGNNQQTSTQDTITASVDTVCVVKEDSLIQCHAITKKGTQCERLVTAPDTLCFQHKKMN